MNVVHISLREGPGKIVFLEARSQLGEEGFATAWTEVRKMKMKDAIDYTLAFPSS
jgi:hypothetical protein